MHAGTLEHWRGDKSDFKDADLSKRYRGFGGSETWLDITKWESLKGPMSDRIRKAASQSCAYIEFDNTDWYVGCMRTPRAERATPLDSSKVTPVLH